MLLVELVEEVGQVEDVEIVTLVGLVAEVELQALQEGVVQVVGAGLQDQREEMVPVKGAGSYLAWVV